MKSLTNPEQMAANGKANIRSLLTLTDTAISVAECVASLNLNFACAMLEEGMANIKAMVDAKSPQDLIQLQSGLARPIVERSVAYARGVSAILAEGQRDVTKRLDARMIELNETLAIDLEYAAKLAPAGSGPMLKGITSAIAAGNKAFETLLNTSRQLAGVIGAPLPVLAIEHAAAAEKLA